MKSPSEKKSPSKVMRTPKQFLDFFSKIPEDKWTSGELSNHGQCCALGHLGVKGYVVRQNDETVVQNVINLSDILQEKKCVGDIENQFDYATTTVYMANDGGTRYRSPKKRMIYRLQQKIERQIKQQKKAKDLNEDIW